MKNYSKRLIDVIEYSREEAARLQNSYIGPEHLMLGIIREGEGEAMRVLRELHTDPMDIKRKIEQEIKNTFDSEDSVQHEIAISKTTERVRFDIAHEIGHLMMHEMVSEDVAIPSLSTFRPCDFRP